MPNIHYQHVEMSNAPDFLTQFKASLIKDDVDIITFAESEDYLGLPLYPRQRTLLKIMFLQDFDEYDLKVIKEWSDESGEVTMVPRLMDRIEYLKANDYPHFRTVQLVGGRRSGKGYMTAIAIAYKAYLMTQEENPGKKFGIAEGKDIYFSIVADSLDQAKAHQFGDAANAILSCKPLLEQGLLGRPIAESISIKTPADVRREMALKSHGVRNDRDLATLKIKAFGTNSKTIRGSASLMFIFDEMAHLISGESRMSDDELWKASIPSLAQFKNQSMVFANSSPYTKTGRFFELYNQAFAFDPKDDPTGTILYPDHFMLQFPSWEMYKDWDKDANKSGALIVDPKYDPILAREEQSDPESFKVEYRAQFAEVIDAYLKPEMVDRMFDPNWNAQWLGRKLEPQAGAAGYMRYKGHGDPASVNANFGVAVGHVEEILNEETGVTEPHVVFDFIDAFYPEDFKDPNQPDQPGTIDWLTVVPTITEMINAFRPYEFTFDQFDSSMAIQQLQDNLRRMGIGDTNVYSKFATPKVNERRWANFKAALNLGRVHAPHPDAFNPLARVNSIDLSRHELKYLQLKNGRVEKQSIGPIQTKDIADCIAEVVDALIGDAIAGGTYNALNQAPQFGAQGGFFIGKGNTESFGELGGWYQRSGGDVRGMIGKPFAPERGMRRPRKR
jgi:hypothetical protein